MFTNVSAYAATTLAETADWLEAKTTEMSKFSYERHNREYNDYRAIVSIDAKKCQASVWKRYKKDAPRVSLGFDEYMNYKLYEITTKFDLAKVSSISVHQNTVSLRSDFTIFKRAQTTWYKTTKKYKSSERYLDFGALNNQYAERYTKALKHAVSLCIKDAINEPF